MSDKKRSSTAIIALLAALCAAGCAIRYSLQNFTQPPEVMIRQSGYVLVLCNSGRDIRGNFDINVSQTNGFSQTKKGMIGSQYYMFRVSDGTFLMSAIFNKYSYSYAKAGGSFFEILGGGEAYTGDFTPVTSWKIRGAVKTGEIAFIHIVYDSGPDETPIKTQRLKILWGQYAMQMMTAAYTNTRINPEDYFSDNNNIPLPLPQ